MEPLSVAVLAGGMSRRMGRDKALLRIGSHTLIEIVASRSRSVASELFVVASDGDAYANLGFRVVPDLLPNAGSLGGIYTALRLSKFEHCLVIACDMPLVNPRLLEYMADLPRNYDVAIPSLSPERSNQGQEETLETLHAIYSRTVLPAIERQIQAGHLKIADVLNGLRVHRIVEEQIRTFDPELRSFFNVNTPEDFAFVRSALDSPD